MQLRFFCFKILFLFAALLNGFSLQGAAVVPAARLTESTPLTPYQFDDLFNDQELSKKTGFPPGIIKLVKDYYVPRYRLGAWPLLEDRGSYEYEGMLISGWCDQDRLRRVGRVVGENIYF